MKRPSEETPEDGGSAKRAAQENGEQRSTPQREPAAAGPAETPTAPSLPRPQLVALVEQLMARNGVSAMTMVQRRAAAGEGFSVRGLQMDSSVLREALANLSPAAKAELASHVDQQQKVGKEAQAPVETQWTKKSSSVWVRDYGARASEMIAAFDMDGTLINPKSDREYGCTANDWRWWHSCVPDKLRKLAGKGFKLVIFSNQSGIGSGKVNATEVHELIDTVQAALGVPLLAVIATGNDFYRKPQAGMWNLMDASFNGGVTPSVKTSFFVGDAAGRPKTKSVKKDFSDSDLKFAMNVGVAFKTPEDFFLGVDDDERPVPASFDFDPRSFRGALAVPEGLQRNGRELVLMVGPPCSGKSTFARKHFPNYTRVTQEGKTREKCVAACREALQKGQSTIIDNQNRDRETRQAYIAHAAALNVTVRAIYFDVEKGLCFHLDKFRTLNGGEHLPSIAIHMFWSKLEVPVASEGFSEIVHLTGRHFKPEGAPEDVAMLTSFLS